MAQHHRGVLRFLPMKGNVALNLLLLAVPVATTISIELLEPIAS